MSTLTQIRRKVRLLTGRRSPAQITDQEIDDYVNTFYLFDMPEHLRLFTQETSFQFMTEANVDTYDMTTQTVWDGESDQPAVDVYINLMPPAYVAGRKVFWSQSREQFFNIYPPVAQISSSTVGDGTPGPYTTTLANSPVLSQSVTVGAIDDTGGVLNLIDVPTSRTEGTWEEINTTTAVTGSVSYLDGELSVTFPNNIPSGNKITFTGSPYQPNRPIGLLFYDNIITMRPVPDHSYLVNITAFKRPTALLSSSDYPELKQWWQYLAYGAAKKVFEDSQDPEGVASIAAEYDKQERLVLRRTIVQRTNQRTSTIYTQQLNGNINNWTNWNN